MYYNIDESLAKQANTMNSFYDYKPNTATNEYKASVDEATALAEVQKKKVSKFYHDRIDALLDSYCRRLADWINDNNRNRASCPSIMVSGGSNFPVAKKRKQNAREDMLFEQLQEIQAILEKIKACGTGPVDLADPHAREILQEKLEKLEKQQDIEKKLNRQFLKTGSCIGCPDVPEELAAKVQKSFEGIRSRAPYIDKPFPNYELASMRGKIKRIRERLEELDKKQAMPEAAQRIPFDGGEIVQNVDLNRLQIFFEEKPDLEVRDELKSNGFRWAPSQGAWQRQLTDNAIRAAREVLCVE